MTRGDAKVNAAQTGLAHLETDLAKETRATGMQEIQRKYCSRLQEM